MLENVPRPLGRALEGVRAGMQKVVYFDDNVADAPEDIRVGSPAFQDGAPLPARFTADGAKLSPPLEWQGVPEAAAAVVLLIEDPDAPMPEPLVHCIAWDLPGADGGLAEGALPSPGSKGSETELGHNSYLQAQYLPPDPPTGHGGHHYVFQVFALDQPLELQGHPGRGALVHAIKGRVLAKGRLIGTYERP
jgi:Raf kinase inhibitor-like YbhB/YbcL family protein